MADTVPRSINVPIAGPLDGETWATLRAALRTAWGDVTQCANWMLSELYLRDWHRTPELERLPKMPPMYLYPEARERWPQMASQTVATLEHEVKRKWRARRYHVLWTGEQSLPVQRYPQPLPVPSQMWRLTVREARYYVFSARIGDQRYQLRVAGGPGFVRAHRRLAEIVDGEIRAGAAYLSERVSHAGHHRVGMTPTRRLMLRISIAVPRRGGVREGTLYVRTTHEALLVASRTPDGEPLWQEHHQQIRRALAASARQQQQLADDLKAERRRSRRQKAGIVGRMGRVRDRRRRQLDSWLHEAAAHVVGYARRHRMATIVYDDAVRSFANPFPWYQLRERVAQKCEEAGIECQTSGSVVEDGGTPLADETR